MPFNPHWKPSGKYTVCALDGDLTLINDLIIRKPKGIANENRNKDIISHIEFSLVHILEKKIFFRFTQMLKRLR